jgi:hypothetical protein
MDYIDKIRDLQLHARKQIRLIEATDAPKEEATKTTLIQPFINEVLGYNTNDFSEVRPEFSINTKSLRIDYAILKDELPIILIECKSCTDILNKKDIDQLITYYPNIKGAKSKFGALTNGVRYQFYTDIKEKNILDEDPFFEFDLFRMIDSDIVELGNFIKSADLDNAHDRASQLKKMKDIRSIIAEQFSSPTKEFVKFIAKQDHVEFVNDGVIQEYSKLITTVLDQYILDRMNDRWTHGIKHEHPDDSSEPTKDELKGYYLVKTLLKDLVDPAKIVTNKSENSFDIVLQRLAQTTICRLYLNDSSKYIGLFDEDGNETKTPIDLIDDIYKYSEQIASAISPQPKSFLFEGQRYEVKFWKDMLPKVCAIMATQHKDRFEKILNLRGHKNLYFSKNKDDLKLSPELIEGTDIYAETAYTKNGLLNQSKKVIALFDYPEDAISFGEDQE